MDSHDQVYFFNCPECQILHSVHSFSISCPRCGWHACAGFPSCDQCPSPSPLPDHVHACTDSDCAPHGELERQSGACSECEGIGDHTSVCSWYPAWRSRERARQWAALVFSGLPPATLGGFFLYGTESTRLLLRAISRLSGLVFLLFGACVMTPEGAEFACRDYHVRCAQVAVTSADKISCDADYRLCSPYPAHEFLCARWAGVSDHLVCVVVQ